jgi:hypothetical protein
MRSSAGRSSFNSVGAAEVTRSRRASYGERSEEDALSRHWGVAGCARCGRTIMLGEPIARVRRDGQRVTMCPECLDPAPPVATFVAAPRRLSHTPVCIGKSAGDMASAA